MVSATRRIGASALLALLLVAFFLPGGRALASEIEVRAEVSVERPVVGDRVQYTVTVEGANGGQLTPPDLKGLESFSLDGGASTTTETRVINGISSYLQTWRWPLTATREGKFSIPSAVYQVNGQSYPSNTIDGEVIGDSGTTLLSAKTEYPEINRQLEGKYFILAEFPHKVWSRQVVPVEIYLYIDPSLPAPSGMEVETARPGQDFVFLRQTDFWNTGMQWAEVDYDGTPMKRALLSRAYYTPAKSGLMNLINPTYYARLPTKNRGRRGFDDDFLFLQPNAVAATLRTRPSPIEVAALPPAPSGTMLQVVGDAKLAAVIDRTEVPRLDPVTLKVTLEGEGNLSALPAPVLPNIPGLILADTQTEEKMFERKGKLFTRKEYQLIFQARDAGQVAIPAFEVAIFDTASGAWTTKKTPAYELKVTPSASGAVEIVTAPSKGEVPSGSSPGDIARTQPKRVGDDVAWIDTAPLKPGDTRTGARSILSRWWFWAAQAVPPLLALGLGLLSMRERGTDRSSASYRSREWRRESEAALKEARGKLGVPDRSDFYASLSRGAMSFAAAKLGRPPHGLTIDEAVDGLGRMGMASDATSRLREIVTRSDAMRFSPAEDSADRRRGDLQHAEEVLSDLSRAGAKS